MGKKKRAKKKSDSAVEEEVLDELTTMLEEAKSPIPLAVVQRLISISFSGLPDAGKILSRLIARSFSGDSPFAVLNLNNVDHLAVREPDSPNVMEAFDALADSDATKAILDESPSTKVQVELVMKEILSKNGGCMDYLQLKDQVRARFPAQPLAEIIFINLAKNDPDFATTRTAPITTCLSKRIV